MNSEKTRPNILWFCTDQQRWDTIGALGNSHIHTPNLDKLCNRGIAFTRAYTQSPICTASRASFLTGRYPSAHNVYRNGNTEFPRGETVVTKLLSGAGYYCGLIGKLHLARMSGRQEIRTNDGYDEFNWSPHSMAKLGPKGAYIDWLENKKGVKREELESLIDGPYGTGVPTEFHQSTWCGELSVDFIKRNTDRPWLLSINPFDPHPPIDPPPEYRERYDKTTLPYPVFKESDIKHQEKFSPIDQQSKVAIDPQKYNPDKSLYGDADFDPDHAHDTPPVNFDSKEMKACYYAEVELLDTQIGRITDALKETGQLDNTIIIFTSDHGDMLGDHGLLYKGCRFYDGLVRVPLIVSWPGQAQKDVKSSALMELVDIAPTLLEAAGEPVPSSMQGKSFLNLLKGKTPVNKHKTHVISEYYDSINFPGSHGSQGSMYFDGRYKISRYPIEGLGELYDTLEDPNEHNDLWDSPEHRLLRAELTEKQLDAVLQSIPPGDVRTADW